MPRPRLAAAPAFVSATAALTPSRPGASVQQRAVASSHACQHACAQRASRTSGAQVLSRTRSAFVRGDGDSGAAGAAGAAVAVSQTRPCARAGRTRMSFGIGARVRVTVPDLTMYHLNMKAAEGVLVTGMEGKIVADASKAKGGGVVSATAPWIVSLDEYPRKKAHFAEDELELIAAAGEWEQDSS